MEDTLKASLRGLERVDQARRRAGWNRQSVVWAEAAFTSVASLRRFWRRERISRETFIHICQAVGISEWQAIAESATASLDAHSPGSNAHYDWGEAPELTFFCGREAELATLEHWIVAERCKLVALLGMGGMGKTTLAVKLAETLAFDVVIWRSLRNAPKPEMLLASLLRVLAPQQPQGDHQAHSLEWLLSELMACLRNFRCLVVLDNVESILDDHAASVGCYHADHRGYGELWRRVGEERHQSCLLLTSREQLREVALLEGEKVRSLRLPGLHNAAGQEVLAKVGAFTASPAECQLIVEHYAGNPLALRIAASGIRDLLHGNVGDFLTLMGQGSFSFGDIHDLLERHCDRLSPPELEVMDWMAIARESVTLDELKADLLSSESSRILPETLDALKRRSLLELSPTGFTLQPAVMEFVTKRLLDKLFSELITALQPVTAASTPVAPDLPTLRTYALMKATAQDYIREAQTRLILEPLSDRLQTRYDAITDLQVALLSLLPALRGKPALKTGYIGGNVLNLLIHLNTDLSRADFSHLTLWQADLRQALLHDVTVAACDLSRSAFTEIFSRILCLAFSADGKTLAKSDDSGWITLWQVETGEQQRSFKAHDDWVFAVAFSPAGGDRSPPCPALLATGSLDRTVKLWDLSTGDCLRTFHAHTGGISALAFSPTPLVDSAENSRQLLASSSSDQTIQLLDWDSGDCYHTLVGHKGIVRAIAFSPDGAHLASASLDHTINLWDVFTGRCLKTLTDCTPVNTVTFLSATQLVTGGDDGIVKVWDIASGLCLDQFAGHSDRVWSLAASADSHTLISSSDDKTIKVWDVSTGRCLKTLLGHQNRIWSVVLSCDLQTLASGSDDKTVRLWNVTNGQCLRILQGYYNGTSPIVLTHGDRSADPILFTFSDDQTVRLWNIRTHQCLKTLRLPTKAALHAVLSPDGKSLASGSLDCMIRLCDVGSGRCIQTLAGHTTWVRSVTFSPDGRLLASAGGDRTIKLWELITGNCVATLQEHTSPVHAVAFHANGTILASSSWDQTVKVWNLDTQRCLRTLEGHRDRVNGVVFTPDHRYLLSNSNDCTIRLWDWQTGTCIKVFEAHRAVVMAIACSPNEPLFASASQDGTLRLWHLETYECLASLPIEVGYSQSLIFSADGRILVSGGAIGRTSLWDVRTGDCLHQFQVPRPYEGMNIRDSTGLTDAQKATLKTLGAIEQ